MSPMFQDGWTALIYAADEGHVSCVEVLVQAGANLNTQDKVRDECGDDGCRVQGGGRGSEGGGEEVQGWVRVWYGVGWGRGVREAGGR